jgi:hypothetical protein
VGMSLILLASGDVAQISCALSLACQLTGKSIKTETLREAGISSHLKTSYA